jgi:hypothetical protein
MYCTVLSVTNNYIGRFINELESNWKETVETQSRRMSAAATVENHENPSKTSIDAAEIRLSYILV